MTVVKTTLYGVVVLFVILSYNELYSMHLKPYDTNRFNKKLKKLVPNNDGTMLLQSEVGYLYKKNVPEDEKNNLAVIPKKHLPNCVSSNGLFCLVPLHDKKKAIVINTVTENKTNEFPFDSLQSLCAINNKGNLIIVPYIDKTHAVTELFDPNNPNKTAIIPYLSAHNLAVTTFANKENKFALGEKKGIISLYSYNGTEQKMEHFIDTKHATLDLKFSPDDQELLSSAGSQLLIINVRSGKVVAKIDHTKRSWVMD
jgi:WD40 repeat protein